MSIAGTYRIVCDQGKTFTRTLTYGSTVAGVFTPFDNSGMSARMQVRRTFDSNPPVLNLTTGTGEIVLGGVNGNITVTVDAVTMATLRGDYVYDLELVDTVPNPDIVYGIVRGSFTVRPEVTK